MTAPGTRLTWSTTAQGTRTLPVILVAGVAAVFVPESSGIVGCALSGTIDSAWWPGATADLTASVKPWLSLTHGIQWSERARPTDAQALEIGAIEVLLSDAAGAATALFAQRDALVGTPLTAEVSSTATTLNVLDTGAYGSSGVVYLGREAIAYASKTSTTFAGCTRAQYGSFATRHLYSTPGGGIRGEVPEVTDGPFDMTGRVASLWLCTVNAAGTITAAELEFFGHIGADVALASDGDGWLLRIDHAVHKIGQPLRAVGVTVGGFSHVGNRGVTAYSPSSSAPAAQGVSPPLGACPLYLSVYPDTSSVRYQVALSDVAADPDGGGWHPDRASFLSAFQRAIDSVLSGADHLTLRYSNTTQRLRATWSGATSQRVMLLAPWLTDGAFSGAATTSTFAETTVPMPSAWVPITTDSRVYLTPGDYASLPAVPTNPASGVPGTVNLFYALAFGGGPSTVPGFAKITAMTSSGGVSYLTVTAMESGDIPVAALTPGTLPGVQARYADGAGFVLTAPTPARLALVVEADMWVDGVQALLAALDTDAGDGLSEAVDWDDMRLVLSRFPPPFPVRRRFLFDLETSPLAWLLNECALNGYALTLRRGRVTVVRVAEFAVTEASDGTVTSIDLTVSGPTPGYARGADPLVNRFTVKWPNSKYAVNVFDATSLSLYGHQRAGIEATMPFGAVAYDVTAEALYGAITTLGMTTLGPHRRPSETIDTSLSLAAFGLQLGDLVDVTLWRVPDQARGRGITHAVGQVTARSPSLYGDGSGGSVKLTLRLSPAGLAGWAPSIVVAASGISGGAITAETSPFGGTSGCAPLGQSPTYGFVVGDKVRLVEIDNASPTTATQHTVTAVSPTVLTVTPSPNATFVALAASTYKVVVVPDDYDTSGLQTAQKRYAYLAPRATLLLATGVRAQRYAA